MKTTTLLAAAFLMAAAGVAGFVAKCSPPPAKTLEKAEVSSQRPVPSPEAPERERTNVMPARAATSVPEVTPAAAPSGCDCVEGTVCVENAPMPPAPGPSPGECRATPAGPGNACQGLQVYDQICGGCVPSPCAGRCRPPAQTSRGLCQVRPEGCDPVDCQCFNPCAPLQCSAVGSPPHIRCTRI
jgi:hypothetical protein